MSVSARLKSYLDENRIQYTTISHSPAYTAQGAAATLHVPGKELAKSVVINAGGRFMMAVLPASQHVDLKRLGELLGTPAVVATEVEFIGLFPDCEPGAMPPFGHLYNLPVYVEETLSKDEEIVFNAGTHRDAIRMKYADFVRLAQPIVERFAVRTARTATR